MIVSYYARLLAGLHLAEVLSSFACFLPRNLLRPLVRRAFYEGEEEAAGMAERAERQLLDPRQLRTIRLDGALALAWLATCLTLYGAHAWALGLAVLGRALLVSFLDNAPHYEGALGDPGQGFDSEAPRLVMPLILNTNLHGTHHRHPNLPWTELPRALDADAAPVAGSYFALPWRQLRGPLAWPPQATDAAPSLKG
jgi:fatty acid desaturase